VEWGADLNVNDIPMDARVLNYNNVELRPASFGKIKIYTYMLRVYGR
jgi:hypothetical protein